ncbi:putative 2-oxoglutarate-dependent dioxygenase [Heracleum sosnowskyi]|uniref:2-oxoglutarate-dependent dioxygenase n=1 Tax=Heracleum sosnowskyi TaxID=360622 RepID=A0AAD8HEB9_9APIA|nr:putative 2-oxoglutarate-dependent dioxygenase [Heracleum sosnowskyi]
MNCIQSWPEPVVRVQSLSDSGIRVIPERYVKRQIMKPSFKFTTPAPPREINIPVINLENLLSQDLMVRQTTLDLISASCREWGFFQIVNHGVSNLLMDRVGEVWREFFHLPVEEKQAYANCPTTYEGYGSRLGIQKGAKLDWSDYFFLNYLPTWQRNEHKWPTFPSSCKEIVGEYNEAMVKLCRELMKILSTNLGLEENHLQQALGGDEVGASLRVNYYPKCPQPDLTFGLSPHSDPGAMTILLADDQVSGLQVRKDDNWVTVKPVPNAFIVNIGDQVEVLSNGNYTSVEHRVVVNSCAERVSLAFFYNPKGDKTIQPAKELITANVPAQYLPMTFNEYRTFVRTRGPSGKSSVESIKSPR